jgi:hypothetical protein
MSAANDFDRDAFLRAVEHAFSMEAEDARQVTRVIEDCFIGEDEVNDEDLDKETRSLFYALEAEGLLTFRRTEYKFEGAVRRAFFWRLTEDVLTGALFETPDENLVPMAHEAHVYESLSDDMWARSGEIQA